jgi:hypothetical protein
MNWKRLLFVALGSGAGFAVCAAIIGACIYWYSIRPKAWNRTALKATFETLEFDTQPLAASYKVNFLYDVQNTTQRNYEFQPYHFTLLAVLAESNALLKEFGHYQAEEPRLDGPAFIKEKVGVTMLEATTAWKVNAAALNQPTESEQLNRRKLLVPGDSEQSLFETTSPARWIHRGGQLFLGAHEFREKTEKRTYKWESTTYSIRKFALVTNENKVLEERINLMEFRVFWKANVKADARFYDVALEEIKVVRKEFRAPTKDEISRFHFERLGVQAQASA